MKLTISSKSEPISPERFIKQIQYLCKCQKISLLYPGTTFETTNQHFLTECEDNSLVISSTDNFLNEY